MFYFIFLGLLTFFLYFLLRGIPLFAYLSNKEAAYSFSIYKGSSLYH